MEKNKLIIVDVDVTTSITSMRDTQAVIYSHDEQAPQLQFNITKNGSKLTDATNVSLLLSSANYRGYVKEGLSIKLDASLVDSTVTFDLPTDLLRYQGYVRADLYLYWQDGANDAAQPFIFNFKKSTIDAQASVLSYVYISDFEREKLRVTQAADAAINTIDTNEVIAQFNKDKQEVANAKTDALATITNAPNELTSVIDETKTIISKRPNELNDAINQAQDAIAQKVSSVDAQSAISSIGKKVEDVDTAKSQAKQSMATSVSNVQQTASAESDKITGLLPELQSEVSTLKTDLQNLSTSETQAISAIRPKLLQDVSDTTAKIDELIVLQNQNAITKQVQTAWANSADGVTDFTTVKPNENILAGGAPEKTTGKNFIGNYLNLTDVIEKYGLDKAYTLSFDIKMSNGAGNFTIYSHSGSYTGKYKIGNVQISLKSEGWNRSYITFTPTLDLNSKITTTPLAFLGLGGGSFAEDAIPTVRKIKLEIGLVATLYLVNKNEDASHSFMQYKGYSNISSSNYADYKWSQSDEYRDYKEDKLTQAIIALGGTI